MKNILIVSYFFPPSNFVASNRPYAFATNLKKYGLNSTVITRHWEEDDKNWSDMDKTNATPPKVTEHETHTLIQLPYLDKWYGFCKPFHKVSILRKLLHTFYIMLGVFYPHESAHECFYDYISNYVKKNKVDYIMVISSPLNIIKLGHLISKEFEIPLIADFRDLWDNGLLADEQSLGFESRLKNVFYEKYLKCWLETASLVTSVSEPLIDEIKRIKPNAKTAVIMNGFEQELFDKSFDSHEHETDKFTFSIIGTLYPQQDLSILIDGIKRFVKDKPLDKIRLNFIGVAVFPEVESLLKKELPEECVLVTERIPREKALEKISESNVLFYAGWKGFKGVVSAKFYEYICSGRKTLIAPGDKDIIERIVGETNTGEIADSAEEFAEIMNNWFDEWEQKGFLSSETDKEKVLFYSRENQTKILAEKIKEI